MRSIDQIVRDTLGNQAIEIIKLQAKIEELQEALKNAKRAEDPAV